MEDKKLQAKKEMLKMLRKIGSDDMGKKMLSMPVEKVTVAAPTREGLKKGLSKAEEILESMPKKSMDESEESYDEESEEHSMLSEEELNNMSKEELIAHMKKMM